MFFVNFKAARTRRTPNIAIRDRLLTFLFAFYFVAKLGLGVPGAFGLLLDH